MFVSEGGGSGGGSGAVLMSREAEGQQGAEQLPVVEKFSGVGRSSLDIFSPTREGEALLLSSCHPDLLIGQSASTHLLALVWIDSRTPGAAGDTPFGRMHGKRRRSLFACTISKFNLPKHKQVFRLERKRNLTVTTKCFECGRLEVLPSSGRRSVRFFLFLFCFLVFYTQCSTTFSINQYSALSVVSIYSALEGLRSSDSFHPSGQREEKVQLHFYFQANANQSQ